MPAVRTAGLSVALIPNPRRKKPERAPNRLIEQVASERHQALQPVQNLLNLQFYLPARLARAARDHFAQKHRVVHLNAHCHARGHALGRFNQQPLTPRAVYQAAYAPPVAAKRHGNLDGCRLRMVR